MVHALTRQLKEQEAELSLWTDEACRSRAKAKKCDEAAARAAKRVEILKKRLQTLKSFNPQQGEELPKEDDEQVYDVPPPKQNGPVKPVNHNNEFSIDVVPLARQLVNDVGERGGSLWSEITNHFMHDRVGQESPLVGNRAGTGNRPWTLRPIRGRM